MTYNTLKLNTFLPFTVYMFQRQSGMNRATFLHGMDTATYLHGMNRATSLGSSNTSR